MSGGVQIRVEINDKAFRRALGRLKANAENLRPALKSIGEAMLRSTDDRFKNQVSPDGLPWTPLSRPWRAYKERKHYILKILQMRGRLRSSIVYQVGDDELAVGTNVIYAAIHQLGGEIRKGARKQTLAFKGSEKKPGQFMSHQAAGRRKTAVTIRFANIGEHTVKMPARPFLGFSERDKRAALAIIREHLAGENA